MSKTVADATEYGPDAMRTAAFPLLQGWVQSHQKPTVTDDDPGSWFDVAPQASPPRRHNSTQNMQAPDAAATTIQHVVHAVIATAQATPTRKRRRSPAPSGLTTEPWLRGRPDACTDIHGFLLWEYRRLRALTEQFGFVDKVDTGPSAEIFALQALYGIQSGSNRTLQREGRAAKTYCVTHYQNLFKRVSRAFKDCASLPFAYNLRDIQKADATTEEDAVVRVQFLNYVLSQWFTTIFTIIEENQFGGLEDLDELTKAVLT